MEGKIGLGWKVAGGRSEEARWSEEEREGESGRGKEGKQKTK